MVNDLSLKAALEQLGLITYAVARVPEVPEELAEDLRQVTLALPTHVFYLAYQKRLLDEARAELERL